MSPDPSAAWLPPRRLRIPLIVLVLAGVTAGLYWGGGDEGKTSVDTFLERHWHDPLPPQGTPPAGLSELEASLAPEDCAACHEPQHRDWSTSKHAKAVGLGLRWQLPLLGQKEGNNCLRCHAPLAEQKALMARRMEWASAPDRPPPDYVPGDLDLKGVTCPVCHVRRHQRYGPPARTAAPSRETAHGGFTAHAAFQDSRFCAPCHQFPDDGPRVNGKLHEDTYRQWLESPARREGRNCQSCHMPDRRHLWRGIHDREMVRSALDVSVTLAAGGKCARALRVTLRNTGAGHHLPTYMVPKLVITATWLPSAGPPRAVGREVVGWRVETDMATERFDTRIPAGAEHTATIPLCGVATGGGGRVRTDIDVWPREHYERMFRQVIADPKLPADAREQAAAALEEAEAARYRLLSRSTAISP